MSKSYLWDLLKKVEAEQLPDLLSQPERWNSVLVDYEPPFVERLWVQLDDVHRLFMHHIAPCEGNALWHPHPWPSIVKVMPGSGYEHGVGYDTAGDGNPPPVGLTQVVYMGMTYEMPDPHAWHYVRPLGPSWSLMITGRPFDKPSPGYVRPTKQLYPLSEDRKREMLHHWGVNFLEIPYGL